MKVAVQLEIELPEGARMRALGRVAKRTKRQRFLLDLGLHPFTLLQRRALQLAPGAPPPDDRKAPGPRCGGCRWLAPLDGDVPGSPLRCWIDYGRRVTRGDATEVRAWWPACEEFRAPEPR